jgi:hypothetical protein
LAATNRRLNLNLRRRRLNLNLEVEVEVEVELNLPPCAIHKPTAAVAQARAAMH